MKINLLEKIEKLSLRFGFTFQKNNSPKNTLKVNNTNVEKITQTINNNGMSYEATKDLILLVTSQELELFKKEAITINSDRKVEFQNLLIDKTKALLPEELYKLKEPDTQQTLIEAANISGRKKEKDLRSLLANLVVKRIKKDESGQEDFKDIVYNEAILTINKLTSNQLKIITLCYLLNYTNHSMITSYEGLNDYFNTRIKPFLGFKMSSCI